MSDFTFFSHQSSNFLMQPVTKSKKQTKKPRTLQDTYYTSNKSVYDNSLLPNTNNPLLQEQPEKKESILASLQYQITKLTEQQKEFSNILEEVVHNKNQHDITQLRDKVQINFKGVENQFLNHQTQLTGVSQQMQNNKQLTDKKMMEVQTDILQIMQQVIQLQENYKKLGIRVQKNYTRHETYLRVLKKMLKKSKLYEFYLQCSYGANNVNNAKLPGTSQKVNFATILNKTGGGKGGGSSNSDQAISQYADILNETIKQNQANKSQLQQLQNSTNSEIQRIEKVLEQKLTVFSIQLQKQSQLIDQAIQKNTEQLEKSLHMYKSDINEQNVEIAKIRAQNDQKINDIIHQQQKRSFDIANDIQANTNMVKQFGVEISGLQQVVEDVREKQQSLNAKINGNETFCTQLQAKIHANYEEFQIFTQQQKIYQYFIKTDDLVEQTERLRAFSEDNNQKLERFSKEMLNLHEKFADVSERLVKSEGEKERLQIIIQSDLRSVRTDVDNCQKVCNIQTISDLISSKIQFQTDNLTHQQQISDNLREEMEILKAQLAAAKAEHAQMTQQLTSQMSAAQTLRATLPQKKKVSKSQVTIGKYESFDSSSQQLSPANSKQASLFNPQLQAQYSKTNNQLLNMNKRLRNVKEDQESVSNAMDELARQVTSTQNKQNAKIKKMQSENVEILSEYLDQFNEILETVQKVGLEVKQRYEKSENVYEIIQDLQKQMDQVIQQSSKMQHEARVAIDAVQKDVNMIYNQISGNQTAVKQYINKQADVERFLETSQTFASKLNQHEQLLKQQQQHNSELNQSYIQLLTEMGQYKQQFSQFTQVSEQLKNSMHSYQNQLFDILNTQEGQKSSTSNLAKEINRLQKLNDLLQGKIDLCNTKVETSLQQYSHLQATQQLQSFKSTLSNTANIFK